MKKILPMQENIIYAWPEHNFLLSAIGMKNTAYDWIMNMYVQIYSSHFEGGGIIDDRISFYPNGSFTVKANIFDLCPFVEKFVMDADTVNEKWPSYVEYLVDRIDHNYYCACMIDREFMSKSLFFHPIYIVGYDLSQQVFICFDNFEHGKYKMKEINFEIIENGYKSMISNYTEPYWNSSFSYKIKDYYYEFNVELLRKLLLDYIKPRENICYLNEFINIPSTAYKCKVILGIESYELLISNVQNAYRKNVGLDWRSFSFFCDHKHIMNLRYQYLVYHGYISANNELKQNLQMLEKKWLILQNKCIKYNLKRDVKILENMEQKIIDLKYCDERLIEELLLQL